MDFDTSAFARPVPGGLVEQLFAKARAEHWPIESLGRFRMEDDSGAGSDGDGGESSGDDDGGMGSTGADEGDTGSAEGDDGTLDEHAARVIAAVRGDAKRARAELKSLKDRLKALEPKAAQFDALEAASKTEVERAQEATRAAEERASARLEKIAAAEVKAALAGIVSDPAAVVADLNLSRFIDEDGEVDADAITELRDRYAALVPAGARAPKPNAAQGANGGKEHEKAYTVADLRGMPPERINQLRKEGKLNALMGRRQQ